ncbi:MAG: hypothetical protein ACK5OX_16675 [Desertimonas sp.]
MADVDLDRTGPPPPVTATVRIGPFRAGSRRFVLDVTDQAVADDLAGRLRDLGASSAEAGAGSEMSVGPTSSTTVFLVARRGPAWLTHPWGVWRDGVACETTVTDEYLRPYVVWEVTRLLLESCRPLIPVHAAAVSRDGRAIVLAGESHAGKSTLAAWLTAHGWNFLTDEVALLERRADRSVWVHPFPRPIGVRRPGPLDELVAVTGPDTEVLVPASELGALGEPAPLAALVFPDRDDGVARQLVARHPATAARELATHLPRLGEDGRDGFFDIVAVAEDVPAYTLGVDDLAAAATTLGSLIAPSGAS